MKKTLSTLAVLFGSAALLVSCDSAQESTNGANATNAPAEVAAAPSGSIVYIQMDSLINHYDMFNDLNSELETKLQAIQDDLTKKGNAWEKSATDFQNKLNKGLLTRSQAEEQQQSILQRQRELQELTQQKQMEMQEEEAVMHRKVMDAVQTYLNSYNQSRKYSLILTTSGVTNTVIVGNPSLDITQDVLKGLNQEYINSKK